MEYSPKPQSEGKPNATLGATRDTVALAMSPSLRVWFGSAMSKGEFLRPMGGSGGTEDEDEQKDFVEKSTDYVPSRRIRVLICEHGQSARQLTDTMPPRHRNLAWR